MLDDKDLLAIFEREQGNDTAAPRPRLALPRGPQTQGTPLAPTAPIKARPQPTAEAVVLPPRDAAQDLEIANLHRDMARLTLISDQLLAQRQALQEERDRLDVERRTLQKKLSHALETATELRRSLALSQTRDVWHRRGLLPHEEAGALIALARQVPEKILEALGESGRERLESLLRDALYVTCDQPACAAVARDHARVSVAKERCEVCGGSDVRLAYRQFADTCQAFAFKQVTIVGGSPQYREQLRMLHKDTKATFALQVVSTERPGEGKRAQSVKDLVVIWGGSEIDHSATNHYRDATEWTLAVAHRGISGMLIKVSEDLQRRKATKSRHPSR